MAKNVQNPDNDVRKRENLMHKLRSAYETAIFLMVLYKRAGKNRARISEATIRLLSRRKQLRQTFKRDLARWLDDFDFVFLEIRRGYLMTTLQHLDNSPAITARAYMPAEVNKLRRDQPLDFGSLEVEAGACEMPLDEDDDSNE